MAYVPHNWKDGELLRAEDLNHLEQGVLNEQIGPVGPAGKDGKDGKDGATGPRGLPGEDGQTPHIGANGNWWLGDTDTGVSASGPTGGTGPEGKPGKDGVGIPAGGTAGQVLAKKTAADYDTEWKDPPESGGTTTGVTSFNGRTGAVSPQKGDYTAGNISFTPGDSGIAATDVQGAITELFTSGSEGKAKIASAVTAKGVETAADASFDTMQANILAIPTSSLPDDVYSIDVRASDPAGGTVSGGGVASAGMTVTVKAKPSSEYSFTGWKENDTVISVDKDYSFPVEKGKSLLAEFEMGRYVIAEDWHEGATPTPAGYSCGGWGKIAFGSGKFVALSPGSSSKIIALSVDGNHWEYHPLPWKGSWSNIAYGAGKFILISGYYNAGNTIAYSVDGINWVKENNLPVSTEWNVLSYCGGKFIAASSSSKNGAYSEDGITWASSTLPWSNTKGGVAYGNGIFVLCAHGDYRTFAISKDGITWSYSVFSDYWWDSIAFGNGRFVTVASNKNISAWSIDGETWNSVTLPSSAGCFCVVYGEGKFVALVKNSNIALWRVDGETWNTSTLPDTADWQGAVYGGGRFVGVAKDKDISVYSFNSV